MNKTRLARTFAGRPLWAALLALMAFALPSAADTKVRIASLRPEYGPLYGVHMDEPLLMHAYAFEVDKETGRARIVIEYRYPSQPAAANMDGGAGPANTAAQIPGLSYDAASQSVIYESAGTRTVCAKVRDRKVLFMTNVSVVPTGACKVTSQVIQQTHDTGWKIQRFHTLDTYFEVN